MSSHLGMLGSEDWGFRGGLGSYQETGRSITDRDMRQEWSFGDKSDHSPPPTALGVKLLPGRYQISARFDGRGALSRNLDMAGVTLLNFWTGIIQSDTLEFDVFQ